MDDALARKLGLPEIDKGEVSGIGGEVHDGHVSGPHVHPATRKAHLRAARGGQVRGRRPVAQSHPGSPFPPPISTDLRCKIRSGRNPGRRPAQPA
ncbi:MAG: hypothetical protein ACXWKY_10765 [Caulobacteraceae bacterium]